MASPGGIRAGKAYVEISGDNSKLARALTNSSKLLDGFAGKLRNVGLALTAAGSGLAAPLALSVRAFEQMGSQLNDMSARTGVTVETLSQLGYAAGQTGASIEDLEIGVRNMQKTIGDARSGGASAVDTFAALGISVEKLAGLNPDQQFEAVATAIGEIADPTQRAAAAIDVFGKSGTKLLPMIAEMGALREEADRLGLTISTDMAKRADALGDAFGRVVRVAQRLQASIGDALAPILTRVSDLIATNAASIIRWMDANQGLIVGVAGVAAGLVAAGGALLAFAAGAKVASFALSGAASIVTGALTAFKGIAVVVAAIASPIGLAVTAIAGLGAAVLYYSGVGGQALKWLQEQFASLSGFVGKVAGAIGNALSAGNIPAAANVLWAALRVAWETGTKPLRDIWINVWAAMESAFVEFTSAVSELWETFSAFLWENFPNAMNFVSQVWAKTWGAMQQVFAAVTNWVTDKWLTLMKLLGTPVDVIDAAKLMNEGDLNEQLTAIEKRTTDAIAEANRKAKRTPEQVRAERDKALADIEARKKERLSGIESGTATALEKANADLATARDEFNRAVQAATSLEPGKGFQPLKRSALPDVDFDGIKQTLKKLDTSFGAGGPRSTFAQERASFDAELVSLQQRQVEELKKIERGVREFAVVGA